MRFASQGNSRQNSSTFRFDITAQVCQRASLTDKIIHQDIFSARDNFSVENRLPGKATESIRAGVRHHVGLHDTFFCFQSETDRQLIGECFRNGVNPRLPTGSACQVESLEIRAMSYDNTNICSNLTPFPLNTDVR